MELPRTKLFLDRPITSSVKVQKLVAALLRNRSFLVRRERVRHKEYLDLGCGPNTHSHTVNLDYRWHPEIDISWDITRGALPLASESMKGIFTEHCLEHIPFEAVDHVLAECWRVLRPRGTIRIVVPDGELYLSRYTRIVAGERGVALPYAEEDRYGEIYSPIMSVNRIFRGHGHLFIYDFDTFRQLLAKNGFCDIARASFGSGRDHQLLLDTASRAVESLYVEASRPG